MKFYYKCMIAVHLENGQVSVRDVALPKRPNGFALLRLIVGGICNTDLELQRGYYGFTGTPGHEFVAEVVEADDRSLTGKRVVGEINLACNRCEWCHKGLGRHCPNRTTLGIAGHPGAFAEYFTLPERNLFVVPDSTPPDRAVFTEPLAAACEILDQVAIPCHERVAVLGDGKLGLLAAMVLNAHGYTVHLYGHHPEKMAIAAEAGVVTRQGNAARAAYGWVVEATGSPEGLRTAAAMTWPRGTVILKSTVHNQVAIDTAPIVVNEVTLVGSRCGRFEAALPLLEHELIATGPMISARYPLKDAAAAFEHAGRRGVLKVLLDA
jgi:alcohol dehydrogenase